MDPKARDRYNGAIGGGALDCSREGALRVVGDCPVVGDVQAALPGGFLSEHLQGGGLAAACARFDDEVVAGLECAGWRPAGKWGSGLSSAPWCRANCQHAYSNRYNVDRR